ncbi:hypothetical protein EJ065_7563 [Corallococcus coralloides]|uniref:Uncharacterized protein n=1 Tax=Corallococcus coralloides TaxID=184914 RepID=A0A410S4I2_CORCK|nr:hypothetical protein [Corallococcus coralloides]QAT89079.1 hypothetical protein EJ065_7563 [Corallococcus coralloides]
MHPRRPDNEAALAGLRTRVPGGKVVDRQVASFPHFSETRQRDGETFIALGDKAPSVGAG